MHSILTSCSIQELIPCSTNCKHVYNTRSALKKILERDDLSTRTMVLCVSSVNLPTSDDANPDDTNKEETSKGNKESTRPAVSNNYCE